MIKTFDLRNGFLSNQKLFSEKFPSRIYISFNTVLFLNILCLFLGFLLLFLKLKITKYIQSIRNQFEVDVNSVGSNFLLPVKLVSSVSKTLENFEQFG